MAQDAGKIPASGFSGAPAGAPPGAGGGGGGSGTVNAPGATDTSNQPVVTTGVTNIPVTVGFQYIISCTTEQTFIDGGAPTATTGMIIPAGGMVGPLTATTGSFQFIATTTNGRVSVSQVVP